MNKVRGVLVIIVLASLLATGFGPARAGGQNQGAPNAPEFKAGEILVKFKAGAFASAASAASEPLSPKGESFGERLKVALRLKPL
jgi:hypothetical protein